MAGLFKKALGIFVEFEEKAQPQSNQENSFSHSAKGKSTEANIIFSESEIDKFEKHFETMFERANYPGPDYYEFWKMMETLELHIPDEKTRMSATFSSLSIQGLTKEMLVETAVKYKELVQLDKANFEKIVNEKSEKEIGQKRKDLKGLEEKIAHNSELIQKLTREISEAQQIISKLKVDITTEETKLVNNKNGYIMASEAMIRKISTDIQKIHSSI